MPTLICVLKAANMGFGLPLLVVDRDVQVLLGGTMSAKGVLIPEEMPSFVKK